MSMRERERERDRGVVMERRRMRRGGGRTERDTFMLTDFHDLSSI